MLKSLLVLVACCGGVLGQTSINGGRSVSGVWDASGAASSKPAKTGATLPSTCTMGEQFFLTTAVAGANLYLCASPNQWSATLTPQSSQNPNQVYAGPASGNSGLPSFRGIVRADLPSALALTDQSNTYTAGTQDLSGASATLPARMGPALPATCMTGEFYFVTGAVAGKNLNICYAANNWSQVAGSGGGGVSGGPIAGVPICNAGAAGQVYYPNDSPYTLWCDGSNWNYRLNGVAVNPPNNASFTTTLQVGGGLTVSGGTTVQVGEAYMTVPAGSGTAFKPSLAYIPNPYGNVWTLTAAFASNPANTAYGVAGASLGLFVRNTASSGSYTNDSVAFRAVFYGGAGTSYLQMQGLDANFSMWANGIANAMALPAPFWIRIHADGTNLIGQYSADSGQNWYTVSQLAISVATGAGGNLSQLGWFVSPDNGLYPAAGALMHWALVNH